MAATASDSATSAATGGGPAPRPAIPTQGIHKCRLQEFCQRIHKKLPIYTIETEGPHHLPKFKCTVEVGGQIFSSTQSFCRRKEAEHDAARVACETLVTRDMGDVKELFELIDQGLAFCKSILYEFSVKMKTNRPSYSISRQEKPTLFVASVVFDGSTYTGEAATSKKDAEQKAAWAAVKSILATGEQDQFTLLMTVQEHNILPAVDPSVNPSAKDVTLSRKRKGRGGGEERVAKKH